MQALSLFSGVGGLDLGALAAGWDVAAATDKDVLAVDYLGKNLGVHAQVEDLSCADPEAMAARAGLTNGDEVLVFGGPPCTGFSHAGFWIERKRRAKDTAIRFLFTFARFVREIRPRAFLLENVPGLLFKNYRHIFDNFLSTLSSVGYRTTYSVLNAADYGVPQARRRLFLVGTRGAEAFSFPPRSTVSARSVSWAFSGIENVDNRPEEDEDLGGRYAHLLPQVPPGDNYLYFTERRCHPEPLFEWRSKYWSFLLKLHPNKPSATIPARRITNNGPFHWENRHLRRREMARLQTFPDMFELPGARSARHLLGNAVPPLLGVQLLLSLRVQLGLEIDETVRVRLAEALTPDASYEAVNALFAKILGEVR